MIFVAAARPPRQSFSEGPSTVFRIAVTACTVVIRPSTIPNLSCTTLARGARQFVVQEALKTTVICFRCTHVIHGGIFRGCGDHDLMSTGLETAAGVFEFGKRPSGFHNMLGAAYRPRNRLGFHRCIDVVRLIVNEELGGAALLHGLRLVLLRSCSALESPVYGVILQRVCHTLRIKEWIVDANDFRLGIIRVGTQDQPPDPAKAINSNLRHRTFFQVFYRTDTGTCPAVQSSPISSFNARLRPRFVRRCSTREPSPVS